MIYITSVNHTRPYKGVVFLPELTTKEKLALAALDLFSRKGYTATSVDEIAGAIGIKGPNIYKYFKGKEDLFNELLNHAEQEYRENMGMVKEKVVHIKSAAELKEFSMKQVYFTLTNDTVRKLRKMYTIEQYRTEQLAELATFHQYTNIMELYKIIFSEMMKSGEMEENDVEVTALDYFAPVSLLIEICDREPDKFKEIMELAERHFDNFIKKNLKY